MTEIVEMGLAISQKLLDTQKWFTYHDNGWANSYIEKHYRSLIQCFIKSACNLLIHVI